ncbi:hypothetical protein BU15DRAFT_69827 [Melanogaster broomeanus]|nr:hypothetical protein BU15DRAFT_69827 [Melanogaster broomeanus]
MPRKTLRSLTLSPKLSSSPGPSSPTFSDATHASAMNFGADGPEKVITRANLKASLQAYDELMNNSANYRAALLHMSKATAAFADSVEKCSGLKGPTYEAGTRLQAASGLHHLIGNHWHVLAETLDKSFEKPLRQHLDTYKTIVNERSASYEKALKEKSEIIRQTEMSNMNKKQRNLQSFREALTVLQRQVDELDSLKVLHYQEIMEHEEEVWDVVQAKVCVAVRSTMDMFDRFTAKSSDPILEPMLQSVPDPFDSYGPPQAEDQIFTILPPLAVIANAPSPSPILITRGLPPAASLRIRHRSGALCHRRLLPLRASASPSATVKRRKSHPPPSMNHHHHTRSSDSKLRTVLSVIDETHTRHATDIPEAGRLEPRPPLPLEMNGGSSSPPGRDAWGGFGYGESPYSRDHERG